LVYKYGDAAKASGKTLSDKVLTGTNVTAPTAKDISFANKLTKDVENSTPSIIKDANTSPYTDTIAKNAGYVIKNNTKGAYNVNGKGLWTLLSDSTKVLDKDFSSWRGNIDEIGGPGGVPEGGSMGNSNGVPSHPLG